MADLRRGRGGATRSVWRSSAGRRGTASTRNSGQWAASLLRSAGGLPLIGGFALVGVLGIALRLTFARWVRPLRGIAEEARLIAMSNPKHRLVPAGGCGSARPRGRRQPPGRALSGAGRRRRDAHSRGERAARGREEHARRPDVEADPGRSGVQSRRAASSSTIRAPNACSKVRRGRAARATGSAWADRSTASSTRT